MSWCTWENSCPFFDANLVVCLYGEFFDSISSMTIKLQDALKVINQSTSGSTHQPFSMEFVTYNQTTKKGGEIITLDNAIRCGLRKGTNQKHKVGIRVPGNSHHDYAVHINLITKVNSIPLI